MTKTYKENQWDDFHIRTDDKNFVTSSGLGEILNYHKLDLPENKIILEIGVGRGEAIKELSKNNKVIGCDVSEIALKNVESLCLKTVLSKNLKQIEPMDFAISHLTFQHCHEQEVLRIINEVNLKEGAWFSFQFASLNPEKTKLSSLILSDLNQAMIYFYSYEKMMEIVKMSNKKMTRAVGPYWFGDPFSFEWNIFQVKNK